MKTLPIILTALFLIGCANPEKTAYRSISVVSVSVDKSMTGWGEYVRYRALAKKPVSEPEHAKVKTAYTKYQAAMAVTESAVLTAKRAPEGQDTFETALLAVEAAAAELARIILSLQTQ